MKLDNNIWKTGSILSPRARLVTDIRTNKVHIVIFSDDKISEPFDTAMKAIKAWGSGQYILTDKS